MLLDSNIIIYSFKPDFQTLQPFISGHETYCSAISRIETLGYHKLTSLEKHYLQRLFETVTVLPVTHSIINTAVHLRQQKRISLGDVLIAATALEFHQTLVTRNAKDFDWIEGLKVIDPLS